MNQKSKVINCASNMKSNNKSITNIKDSSNNNSSHPSTRDLVLHSLGRSVAATVVSTAFTEIFCVRKPISDKIAKWTLKGDFSMKGVLLLIAEITPELLRPLLVPIIRYGKTYFMNYGLSGKWFAPTRAVDQTYQVNDEVQALVCKLFVNTPMPLMTREEMIRCAESFYLLFNKEILVGRGSQGIFYAVKSKYSKGWWQVNISHDIEMPFQAFSDALGFQDDQYKSTFRALEYYQQTHRGSTAASSVTADEASQHLEQCQDQQDQDHDDEEAEEDADCEENDYQYTYGSSYNYSDYYKNLNGDGEGVEAAKRCVILVCRASDELRLMLWHADNMVNNSDHDCFESLPGLDAFTDAQGFGHHSCFSTFHALVKYSKGKGKEPDSDALYVLGRGAEGIRICRFDLSARRWNADLPALAAFTDAQLWSNACYYSTLRAVLVGERIFVLGRGAEAVELHAFDTVSQQWTSAGQLRPLHAFTDKLGFDQPAKYSGFSTCVQISDQTLQKEIRVFVTESVAATGIVTGKKAKAKLDGACRTASSYYAYNIEANSWSFHINT